MATKKGIPHIATDRCKGCGLCVIACPRSVLTIDDSGVNAKGYQPATVLHPDRCIGCTNCGLICPDVVITIEHVDAKQEVKP